MGTRALVIVKENDKESQTLVNIYRQYDGYPSCLGQDIVNILNKGDVEILSGFWKQQAPEHFNGMSCLAAYLVGELKGKAIGNIYLQPVDIRDCGEEYIYTLYEKDDTPHIDVLDVYENKSLFEGPLSIFGKFLKDVKTLDL